MMGGGKSASGFIVRSGSRGSSGVPSVPNVIGYYYFTEEHADASRRNALSSSNQHN